MPTSSLFFLFIDFGFDEVLLGVIRGENLQVWVRLLIFRKFELFNLVILCIGGCQSEKSPFSARYEDGKLYYEGEWYVVLWLTYICEFVTAVHKWQWLLRLNYTPRAMFVDSYAKALIIIISSSHSFLRFHKGDHVLIESRNDTHSRYVYSSCSTISCCVFDSSQSSSISFSSVHCKALILLQDILQQFSEIICWSKKCLDLYNFAMLQP